MKTDIKILVALISIILTLELRSSLAADIDIYGSPTNSSGNPNVLIIIDNSSNWAANNQGWPVGKQGEAELTSLKTIAAEASDDVNLGLMMHTTGDIDGGYVRYHIRSMNTINKTAFQELIGNSSCPDNSVNSLNGTPNCIYKNFQKTSEKVPQSNFSGALFEAFKYFGGYTKPALANSDTAGTPTDATHFGPYRYARGAIGTTSSGPDPNTDKYAFLNYATDSNRTLYDLTLSSCAKNYIIFIGNGMPNSDSPSSLLSGVGGDTSQIPLADYTTSTVTSTTTMGTTTQCYSSAASCTSSGISSFATQCASYTEGCACTTEVASSAPVACASGTLSYTVTGHIAASTTNLGLTTSCYSNTSSCSTSDYAAQCAGASCSCSSTVTSTTGCTGSKKKFSVIKSVAASSSNRGYSPQCYSDATSCSSDSSLSSMCPSCTSFTCAAPTQATTPSCASGTSQYTVVATNVSNVVTPTGTSTVPTGSAINYADEWARFLNRTDVSSQPGQQNVKTYTIDVYKDHQDQDATALLRSMADAGGGKYFVAQNEAAILDALRKIMSEIQSVNSVFASSSLPVSVNTQGTYLNQVFIGMFRPDASGKPRWFGNIKQYQFAIDGARLMLADANGNDAISATTGFITPCAESFWSSDSGNYWDFPSTEAKGGCLAATSQFPSAGSSATYSDLPDGDVVEKGGAAQRLRGVESLSGSPARTTNYATRVLKTCDGACTALSDFNISNSNITQALLGANNSTDRDALIDWVRGKDTEDENTNSVLAEMRPSAHGDVVHSQPGVVDYGGSTGVVTFYGSNEGIFHAINGNKSTSDPNRGKEIWGFVAPETFGRLNRLRNATPYVNIPGVPSSLSPQPKGYFFDGSVAVYQNSGTVWIFPAMRRGGRAIYAFDASTPTAAGISLKWRKGCFTDSTSDDSNCSTGWSTIGQTWSKPQIGTINGYSSPVLVFGGGYDTCEDTDSQTRCTSTQRKGANIWFVDANTGAIIRTYPTNYSVPGDVTIVKNANGYISHVYAGDTGGYLYRINVGGWTGTAPDTTWTPKNDASDITIAYLSETGHARKFMNGPDVVESATFNEVLIGSGDREHPLLSSYACGGGTGGVTNSFFMIKDTPSAGYPSPALTKASLVDVSSTCPVSSDYGWYFNLPNTCEQVVNKATSIGGYTYFGTNQPVPTPTGSCSTNLGVARGYAVKISSGCAPPGAGRSITFTGGGMPPSPVAGIVDIEGRKQTFCLGCGTDATARANGPNERCSAIGGCDIPINPTGNRSRTYWYKK